MVIGNGSSRAYQPLRLAPSRLKQELQAGSDSILFSASDRAVQETLGLFREAQLEARALAI